jgi:hypothetical protein
MRYGFLQKTLNACNSQGQVAALATTALVSPARYVLQGATAKAKAAFQDFLMPSHRRVVGQLTGEWSTYLLFPNRSQQSQNQDTHEMMLDVFV